MGSEDSVASTLLPVHREKRERTRRRGRAREATGWHIGSQKEHGKTARSKRSWRHRGLSNRRKTYRTRIRDKEQNATTADAAERERVRERERETAKERANAGWNRKGKGGGKVRKEIFRGKMTNREIEMNFLKIRGVDVLYFVVRK